MGKEVIVDEFVKESFIFGEKDATMGLLVGAFSESQEFLVAHLAQTFEDVGPSKNGECGSQSGSSSENEGEIQQGEPRSFSTITPISVSHHAKQAIRMLPGGLLVLGLYFIEPIDNVFTSKHETVIKNLITTLNKSLGKNPHYEADFGSNKEKVVLHYNPNNIKFACRVLDGESLKATQVVPLFRRLEWAKLESEYDTSAAMHLAKPESGLPLRKNLRNLMSAFRGSLEDAKFLVRGQTPSKDVLFEEPPATLPEEQDEDLIDFSDDSDDNTSRPSPKKAVEKHGDGQRPRSPLHILIDKTPGIFHSVKSAEDFIDHLHFQGKISCVAFVPLGSSTSHIVKVLKQDILRSMASRMEMHCESLIDVDQTHSSDEEDFSAKIIHEVPRRVYASLPGSKLLVSDYLFPGEGSHDSIVTFRDILSVRLEDESDIIATKEQPFHSIEHLRAKGSMDELLSKAENMTKLSGNLKSNRAVVWVFTLGLIAAAAAITIQYILPRISRRFSDGED